MPGSMRRSPTAAALVLMLLSVVAPRHADAQAQPGASRTVAYEVKPGDTLYGLAERYLIHRSDYRAVARLNRVADPRRLSVGRPLQIPLPLLRTSPAEARIANFRGVVTVESKGAAQPAVAGRGMAEGDVISTGANAFVRLALADGSHVSLPSRSRVRIIRLREILLTGAVDHVFRLESGRVETDVAPVRAPGGFSITTPISVSAVRGTEFRSAYDATTAQGATEVIEGAVAVEVGGDTVVALAAQGVTARTEGLELVDLLPAPELRHPEAPQTAERVMFEIKPAIGARRYRARLATDAGMIDAFAETESVPGDTRLMFDDVGDGVYFVRLSALSADGVEGLASVYSFIRARNGVAGLTAAAGGGRDRPYLFRWEAKGAGPARFRFQLRHADGSSAPLVDQADLLQPEMTVTGLKAGVYEWRVRMTRPAFGQVLETWSEPQQLRVGR